MHNSNREFWKYCESKYKSYFHGQKKVLEVGSFNVNGTVREHFQALEYIGVDWRPGATVDVVTLAHEMSFDHKFDVVISASMLEHDRHWDKSISQMVNHLADDGVLFLSWGAALNPPHCLETADDGGFHCLPAGKVIGLLEDLGIYIHEFHYEGLQFPNSSRPSDMGEVCLVAFKDKAYAIGSSHIDELIPEDRA